MKFSRLIASASRLLIVLAGISMLTGCASFYVDNATREVSASQFKKPQSVHPVQLLFEFQTKGVANSRATEFLKTKIADQVKESGLFTEVTDGPANGGALLSITLNNIPLTDDAFSKGFVTGLTFGLAGSQVSDGYVCTARYTKGAGAQTIEKRARHAIHTTMGASAAPGNGTKVDSINEAVTVMTRQIVSNVLNDVSADTNFE